VALFIYLFIYSQKIVAVIRKVENVGEVYWSGKSLNYHLQFKIYGTTKTSFEPLYEKNISVRRKTSELT